MRSLILYMCSGVLYCTLLYFTLLCFTVLYGTVLYCKVLHCTVLHCTVLYCIVLYCTVLFCTVGPMVLFCAKIRCLSKCLNSFNFKIVEQMNIVFYERNRLLLALVVRSWWKPFMVLCLFLYHYNLSLWITFDNLINKVRNVLHATTPDSGFVCVVGYRMLGDCTFLYWRKVTKRDKIV